MPSFSDAFYTAISAFFRNPPRPVVASPDIIHVAAGARAAIFPRLATGPKSLRLLENLRRSCYRRRFYAVLEMHWLTRRPDFARAARDAIFEILAQIYTHTHIVGFRIFIYADAFVACAQISPSF